MKIVAPLLMFLSMFVICLGLAAIPACHSTIDCKNPANASSASCVAQQAVVDCTAPTAIDYVTQHAGDISGFFTTSGVDWNAVEQALVKLVLPEAICVLDNVVEHYLAPAPAPSADAGVNAAIRTTIDPVPVHQKAAEISAKLWPGKKSKH